MLQHWMLSLSIRRSEMRKLTCTHTDDSFLRTNKVLLALGLTALASLHQICLKEVNLSKSFRHLRNRIVV